MSSILSKNTAENQVNNMLSNLHTHTTFCDGKSTVDEIVQAAIEKGFDSIGFSGHGFTRFDATYCMKDTEGYIAAVKAAKTRFQGKIEVYLGVEEDAFYPLPNRHEFDYVIGSSHYFNVNGKYYPVDSSPACFAAGLEAYHGDYLLMAESYYRAFCQYLLKHTPTIIGHFDLVTKFDELENSLQLLKDPAYQAIARRYLTEALRADCLFEVNTGAISRGYRTTPYPSEDLLHLLLKNGGKLTVTADSHQADTLDCAFAETKQMLKDIGFEYVYVLYGGEFVKDYL